MADKQPYDLQPFPMVEDTTPEDSFVENKHQVDRFDEFAQREQTIKDATWLSPTPDGALGVGDKWQAFSKTWDDTWAVKGYDYFKYDNGWLETPDDSFVESWSNEAILETLNASSLPISYYKKLADAKNPEHKRSLLTWAVQDNNRNDFINKTLNSYGGVFTERTMSSLTTGLLDIDLPIAGTFGVAAKLTKARKVMSGAAAATHLSAAAFVYETSDGEISAGEASLFGLIGSLADGFVVSRIGRATPNTKADLVDATTDGLMDTPTNTKLVKLTDEADSVRTRVDKGKEPLNVETTKDRLNQYRSKDLEFDKRQQILENEQLTLNRRRNLTPENKVATQKRLDKRLRSLERDRRAELKTRTNRVSTGERFKQFNKNVETIQKKAKLDQAKMLETSNVWRASVLKNTQKDLALLGNDLIENVTEWRQYIKESIDSGNAVALNDFKAIINRLHDEGFITKSSFQKYENKLKNNKFEVPEISAKLNRDGSYDLVQKRRGGKKNKLIVSGLLATALAGDAMADDGGGLSSGNVFTLLAGAIALGMGVKNFKNITSTMSDIKLLDRTRPMRTKVENMITSLRTSLTETTAPLMKDGNVAFTDAVKKILWDAEDGTALTVERQKAALFHGFSGTIHKQLDSAYLDYLKANNSNRFKAGMTNLGFGEIGSRMDFEIKVMDYVEQGKHANQPAIVKAGGDVRKSLQALKKEMVDSGVKGSDKMLDLGETFMPRYFRNNEMRVLLRSLDKPQYDSFVKQFAKMMDGDSSKAKQYLEIMTTPKDVTKRITSLDEIEEFITAQNITKLTADEVADALGIGTTRSGRTKARIRIDKGKFETIRVTTTSGETATVNLNDIFVNNAVETLDRYFNSQTGHVAFADAGWKSIDEVRDVANQAINSKNSVVMNDVIDALIGEPILNLGSDSAQMLQTLSNFTVASKMPMSVISLIQETFNSIIKARGGMFKTAMSESVNIFKKHGESSAIVDELMSHMGQGMHRYSASYGSFSHMGEGIDNMLTGTHRASVSGVAGKFSEITRDTVLYNLGLVPVSDFLTRINLVDSASYLHDIAHGSKTMPDYLKKAIGLTPDLESMLRGKLVKNKGTLQKMGISEWDRVDQLEFRKLIDNMMQKRIQQTTMGGTPHWGRSGTFGIVVTQLLKFPLQAFSNHGIFDLKGSLIHKDPRAMGAMMAWFSGGYIAAALRAEIQGRDVDDNDLLLAAVRSMPIVGGVEGVYRSLTDAPAMFGAMGSFNQGMQDTIGVIASDN